MNCIPLSLAAVQAFPLTFHGAVSTILHFGSLESHERIYISRRRGIVLFAERPDISAYLRERHLPDPYDHLYQSHPENYDFAIFAQAEP